MKVGIQLAASYCKRIQLGEHAAYDFCYSNIAFLTTYFVASAGLYLPDFDGMAGYGSSRLGRLYNYTIANGGFPEFNSPEYKAIVLSSLVKMRQMHPEPAHATRVDTMLGMIWDSIARNYHFPTQYWAGATARTYNLVLPGADFLQEASGGLAFYSLDPYAVYPSVYYGAKGARAYLPADAKTRFTSDRNITENGGSYRYTLPVDTSVTNRIDRFFMVGSVPLTITHKQTPTYSLGSATRGDFWSQRQGVLGFFGTSPERTSNFRVRLLRDGTDFAAAHHFTVQKDSQILGAVNFATDGGTSHPNTDLINGSFTASDVRLRFQVSGDRGTQPWTVPSSFHAAGRFATGNNDILIQVPYAAFGGERFGARPVAAP